MSPLAHNDVFTSRARQDPSSQVSGPVEWAPNSAAPYRFSPLKKSDPMRFAASATLSTKSFAPSA